MDASALYVPATQAVHTSEVVVPPMLPYLPVVQLVQALVPVGIAL